MNNDENKLQEQKAPVKNTDNAFVQVGEDGAPKIPDDAKIDETVTDKDSPTTLNHR